MRTWSVVGKYPVYTDGEISHTEITIASTTGGYATYTERVLGDQMAKTDAELVGLAREAHFKIEYADRAMAESVQKIDEIEVVVKSAKKFMAEAEEKMSSMAKSQQELEERLSLAETDRNTRFKAIEDQFAILNGSVMEMITDYYSQSGEEEDVSDTESNDNVDGSDNSTTNENTETEQ
ncbi:DUF1366 domain-containing protein [Streptococcus ruminantium]|uniref:DUF1366 domain-containing protein n=1 Tax=Streptococcus ruminantium TaxID=1917441 RepID=UPI0012DF1327|nr:DUF1366 domain-containing protein [Streptococcus ruminantium]